LSVTEKFIIACSIVFSTYSQTPICSRKYDCTTTSPKAKSINDIKQNPTGQPTFPFPATAKLPYKPPTLVTLFSRSPAGKTAYFYEGEGDGPNVSS
jgi:hypothetical protein